MRKKDRGKSELLERLKRGIDGMIQLADFIWIKSPGILTLARRKASRMDWGWFKI
jgi:hypothetical protein